MTSATSAVIATVAARWATPLCTPSLIITPVTYAPTPTNAAWPNETMPP